MHDSRHAVVVSIGKNVAWIALDGEDRPRLATLRRMTGRRFMPVPGDTVSARVLEDGSALIDRIEPRAFSLERRTAGGRGKTMAANVDALVTVTALADPAPRLVTLDQLLAFAAIESLDAVVVFTKPDLADGAQRTALERLYRGLGYPVATVNPRTGENFGVLEAAIAGRRALLSGISGVGKSSIFAALGGQARVGGTSRRGAGRQTTSAARLHRTGGDGFLIDSPGVNEFGLGEIDAPALAHAFVEMRAPSRECRFTDCTHLREPGCGVIVAVESGAVAASRYASYRKMLTEPT